MYNLKRIITAAMVLSLAFIGSLPAQEPKVEWKKTFFGSEKARGFSVQQTTDKGFIAAGYTYTGHGDNPNFYLVKTDSLGNLKWEKTYGEPNESEKAYWVQQTNDKGYILIGNDGSLGCIHIVKTDSLGNLRWEKGFSKDTAAHGPFIRQTNDQGYIIVGIRPDWAGGLFIMKIDSLGNFGWRKTLQGPIYSIGTLPFPVQQTTDGGYIVAANTLIKTASLGNLQWKKSYSLLGDATFVEQTGDKGFIATGMGSPSTNPRANDIFLLKTDSLGNLQWKKIFGGNGQDISFCVRTTKDRGYVIAGETYSFGVMGDAYIIRTDSLGNLCWTRNLGMFHSGARCIQQTGDGGYIFTGSMPDTTIHKTGLYLVKLAPEGTKK